MKKILLHIIIILNVLPVLPQEIHFSQFYANPIYLSSSYAGSTLQNRIVINYRDQWPMIPNSFVTMNFSFDTYLPEIKSGIGFIVYHDRKGELHYSTTHLGLIYTYDITLSHRYHLRPSLQFSYERNGIDYSALRLPDQMVTGSSVPITIPEIDRFNIFDCSSALLLYDKNFWYGISVWHLFRPYQSNITTDRIPLTFFTHGGVNIKFNGKLIKPKKEHVSLAFNYRQSSYLSQLDIGSILYIEPIYFGLWYRGIPVIKKNKGNDAVIIHFGYHYERFTFGYSYDLTISGLKSNTNGSHEISVVYIFERRKKPKKTILAVPCPTF